MRGSTLRPESGTLERLVEELDGRVEQSVARVIRVGEVLETDADEQREEDRGEILDGNLHARRNAGELCFDDRDQPVTITSLTLGEQTPRVGAVLRGGPLRD
jgi:hypothetical protein